MWLDDKLIEDKMRKVRIQLSATENERIISILQTNFILLNILNSQSANSLIGFRIIIRDHLICLTWDVYPWLSYKW